MQQRHRDRTAPSARLRLRHQGPGGALVGHPSLQRPQVHRERRRHLLQRAVPSSIRADGSLAQFYAVRIRHPESKYTQHGVSSASGVSAPRTGPDCDSCRTVHKSAIPPHAVVRTCSRDLCRHGVNRTSDRVETMATSGGESSARNRSADCQRVAVIAITSEGCDGSQAISEHFGV